MKKSFKIVGAVVGVLFVLGAIGNMVDGEDALAAKDASTTSSATAKADEPKKVSDSDNDGFDDSEDAFPNDDRE